MMSQFNTRVVLYGKSTTVESKQIHKTILNQIEPTEVPKAFICNISLAMKDADQRLTFSVKEDTGNFSLDEIREFLVEKGVVDQVERIEVTLDLDAISQRLTSTANSFLDKYFG